MASNEVEDIRSTPHVLYELLVYKEWKLDIEKHKNVSKYALLERKPSGNWFWRIFFNMFTRIPWPEEDLAKAASLLLPWLLSVSPNGKLVAILEDSVLEIRQAKDEYNSIVGRAAVPKDRRPQFRKMAWTPDSNMIATSSSDGSVRIYDCFGSLLFKIPLMPPENQSKKLIIGLEFIKAREKKGEWELLIIYSCGLLECYCISSIEKCVLDHRFILSETGISCTLFSQQYSILFAAVNSSNFLIYGGNKLPTSITAWRLLNEEPYYQKVYPMDDELSILEIHSKMNRILSRFSSSDCVCKIVLSPSNEFLATLHSRGLVSIWHSPSLRFHSTLDKLDSKKQKILVPLSETRISSHAIDIEWRKDNKLIVAWRNGTVSIHDVNSSVVLTYFGPEFLHGLPRLASASTLHGFLTLECEVINLPMSSLSPTASFENSRSLENEEPSLNESKIRPDESVSDDEKSFFSSTTELFYNTLYFITDIEKYEPRRKSVKFVQRIFRLMGVKMTTPEELFERYLKSEDFDKAFEICEEYGLDVMKVYMRQWRTNEVNEFSIHQYLANVGDQQWILTECLERVPETLSGARHLIEFGLRYTDIKPILDSEQMDLTEEQKNFIVARLKLLDYEAKLKIYEQIVDESSYDMKQYEKFRNQSIVSSAVDFARSANTEAIILLLTNHGDEVLPYWLNILDNYPESLKPSAYSSILPECDGDDKPVKWACNNCNTEKDWAQLEYANKLAYLLNSNSTHKFDETYSFNSETLTRWYKKRALALEKYSTIIENSVDLLRLGMARHIKGLEELLFEFEMLSSLVYDLNINMTYKSFHNETISKKLQLFVQNSDDFCDVMLRWIHPFIEHYAEKGSPQWLSLFTDFMTNNSKVRFGCMVKYFNHVLNGNLYLVSSPNVLINVLLDCIYSYNLLDKVNETETLINEAIRWLNSLKTDGLVQKLAGVQNELKGARILIKYNYIKPISFIHEIKVDFEKCKAFISEFSGFSLKSFDGHIEEWEEFLGDLVDLQQYCFKLVPKEYCFKVCVSYLLKSGISELIEYSPKLLCCSKNLTKENLSFSTSVEIVLEASQYYFNSSSNYDDRFMQLAKTCLLLIKEDNELIQEELDFIFAIRLLSELGVTILPLQVRQTEDKMKLIDMCFDRNSRAYSNPHKIYKLAFKLRIKDRSYITLRLAQESLKRQDYKRCAEFCSDLISNQYSDGWKICMNLAETVYYKNIESKIKLINFSSIHAPARMLPNILNIRNELNKEHIKSKIQSELPKYLDPQIFQNKLSSILESDNVEDMVKSFYQLWDRGYIQDYIKRYLPNDFSMVHPSYYASLHLESCKIIPMNYAPYSNLENVSNFLEIMNYFLKLMVNTDSGNCDSKIVSEVLTTCGIISSSEDTALSLSYMLNVDDSYNILKFFKVFEESSTLFQFAFYFLCLKYSNTSLNDLSKVPLETVSLFLDKGDYKQCALIFNKLASNYKNFKEASQVTLLESGIDSNRFKQDENYKSDTIFGLAMNEQYENLKLAMDLAQKNNIPLHDVVLSHVISLLLNCSFGPLNSRLEDKDLMQLLSKRQELCLQKLLETLPSLSGTNYQQLIFYFTVIKSIKDDCLIWDLIPKEHISLLKKIKSLSKNIDYKSLVSCENELHVTLSSLIIDENINIISKLIRSLPPNIKSKYNFGQFFCLWAVKVFFEKCINTTFKQCVLHFESLNPFFSKLSEEELILFVKKTILSEKGMREMDSELRKHLLASLLAWCQTSNNEFTVVYLQKNLDLLNRLWDEEHEDFSEALINNIFVIEEFLKNSSEKKDLVEVFNNCLLDLSLTTEDILYLYRILQIKEPLMSLINALCHISPQHSKAAEEWRKRFCTNDEFTLHEMILGKNDFKSEDDVLDFYRESLKKHYVESIQPEEFNADLKDTNTNEKFFTTLLQCTKTFDQLLILHSFIIDLPLSFPCNKENLELEILWKLLKIDPGDQIELKYSLAKDITSRTVICEQKYNDLLEILNTSYNFSEKLFISWICLNSENPKVVKKVKDIIENEDESICMNFFDLPKMALLKIIPHVLGSKLYPKLIRTMVQAGNEEVLRHCVEGLRAANYIPEASSLSLVARRIPIGLRSFHTALSI